ncbi:hypothetical protein FP828_05625 [bacterium]|nr:hypothetical protein [bacterium]
MSKKTLALFIAVWAVMLKAPAVLTATAASTATLTLTVTVAPSPSVWIGVTNYDFGNMPASAISISQTSIAVINDSEGLTEKYSIRASDARNNGLHSSPTDWNLASSTGTDQYNLRAVFKADLPGDSDFDGANDSLTNDPITCDGTKFATGADEDGYNSIKGKEEHLWFRIATPSSVKDTNEHTIFITITAMGMD